jgi:tetratricopeptide (TPR) repeat protein
VFVHGFTGAGIGTWGSFPENLTADPALGRFDLYFWEYPSALNLKYAVTKWFWENDPSIETLGDGLRALLNETVAGAGAYREIKLVAHSMGGLVVQAFVVEELRRIAQGGLDPDDSMLTRINEIVMFATPSGGLRTARFGGFLKNQIADMSDIGAFVTNLRAEWTAMVDDRRRAPDPTATFRLTTVAGMKDRFVPPESALDPFPFDEHLMVPGNHVELVKPETVGRPPLDVVVRRITRPTPTGKELRVVFGHSPEAVTRMRLVEAAADIGNVEVLRQTATELLQGDPTLPTVERALGLALGRQAVYDPAVELLRRYLGFTLDDGSRPFADDARVIQQLAVAESGLGQNTLALATLKSLPGDAALKPETLGITAGRIKRHWLASGPPRVRALARQALDTYRAGYEAAAALDDVDEILYNGINTAFMSLALDEPYAELAETILHVTDRGGDDYWVAATRAEALLLLQRFDEAADAYKAALERTISARYLASTGLQANNIIDLMGSPPGAQVVAHWFRAYVGDLEWMGDVAEMMERDEDEREASTSG